MSGNKTKVNSTGAIIVAAGKSKRMGGQDKLFVRLVGEPLLARVIDTFNDCEAIEQIVVVLREQRVAEVRRMVLGHDWSKVIDTCIGGQRRQDSVMAGLERLGNYEWVVIHDGARPLVTTDLIERGLEEVGETGAAVAAVPATDTMKVAGEDGIVQHTPSRENLWIVQTPQVFRSDIIREAYRRAKEDVTDDASLVERAGYEVKLYRGSYDNIKVTTPDDLALAEILWRKRQE